MPRDLIFCGIDTWSSFPVKNVPLSVCIKKFTTMWGHGPGHEVELMMFLKLYMPSTINTWLMFWHTKWGLVHCEIINHGLNMSYYFQLFKFLGCILKLILKISLNF